MIPSDGQPPGGHAKKGGRRGLWPLIFALSLLALAIVAYGIIRRPRPNLNALALADLARAEYTEIPMQPLMDLDFLSQADILRLRTEAAGRTPQLLAAEYRPSDAVFGQIEDGLPWWGILGAHYYGQGEQSIEGPSEQSLSILNPYLLVVPELYMRWDAAAVAEVERFGQDAAFYCIPRDLRWFPTVPRATASYDAACLQRNGVSAFSLIAYNARDLNLNYIFVSYEASRNVTKSNPPGAAYRNPQYLHRGGGCGYPGGCNNISPQTPDIDNIQIAGWPVEVVIWFWRDEPGSVDQPPDIAFVLVFD